MQAYRCDGCREFQAGEPLFCLEATTFMEMTWPDRWDFCSLECIERLVQHLRGRVAAESDVVLEGRFGLREPSQRILHPSQIEYPDDARRDL